MIDWWLRHVDDIVAASNFTIVVMMFILGTSVVHLLRTRTFGDSDIRIMLIGVAVEAYAWSIHRLYWGAWRTLRAMGRDDWNQWFVQHGYLALIPTYSVLFGLILILTPVWAIFNRDGSVPTWRYYLVPTAFIASIWWFLFIVILKNSPDDVFQLSPKPATVFKLDRGATDEDSGLRDSKK